MTSSQQKDQFIRILKENKGILLKVIRCYCKNADDWKDLEQEIVIQLWNSFQNYNPEYKLSTWMYRIALNVAISHYRKESRRKHGSLDEALFILADDVVDELQDARRTLLHQFIDTLDEFNKALIILHLEDHNMQRSLR